MNLIPAIPTANAQIPWPSPPEGEIRVHEQSSPSSDSPRVGRPRGAGGFVVRPTRWCLMWLACESQEVPHRGSHDGSSLQHRGSGSGRCVETSTGRFPAEPSARDWVFRRDFFEKREGTGLLAVLRPFFEKSAAEDPESCRYDVKGRKRLPSPSRPRSGLALQTGAIKRRAREKRAFRTPAAKIARSRGTSGRAGAGSGLLLQFPLGDAAWCPGAA